MSITRALLAVSCVVAFGCGGGGAPKGPVAPDAKASTDVADDNTWMTLSSHGARLRAPPGWTVHAEGSALRAEPRDGKAALILDGATTRAELEAKVRALGARYGLDRVDFAGIKPGNLNGIPIVMFEDMAAESKGEPVDVFVMLGEAPNGKGVLLLFLYASDKTQQHDLELIQAANTLRPI